MHFPTLASFPPASLGNVSLDSRRLREKRLIVSERQLGQDLLRELGRYLFGIRCVVSLYGQRYPLNHKCDSGRMLFRRLLTNTFPIGVFDVLGNQCDWR